MKHTIDVIAFQLNSMQLVFVFVRADVWWHPPSKRIYVFLVIEKETARVSRQT